MTARGIKAQPLSSAVAASGQFFSMCVSVQDKSGRSQIRLDSRLVFNFQVRIASLQNDDSAISPSSNLRHAWCLQVGYDAGAGLRSAAQLPIDLGVSGNGYVGVCVSRFVFFGGSKEISPWTAGDECGVGAILVGQVRGIDHIPGPRLAFVARSTRTKPPYRVPGPC